MRFRSRKLLFLALAVVVVGGVVGPAVLAEDVYEITAEESLDIPERTIEVDNDAVRGSFNISAIKVVESGKDFTVHVTAPSRSDYALHLRNSEGDLIDSVRSSSGRLSDGEIIYDTSDIRGSELFPGTYFLGLRDDVYKTLYPVVVEGYEIRATWGGVPENAGTGSEITVAASMSQRSGSDQVLAEDTPADIVFNEVDSDDFYNISLNQSDGNYSSTTFIFNKSTRLDVPPGEYNMYVAARGTETLEGENVPVGVTVAPNTIQVTEPPTPTPMPTPVPTIGGFENAPTDPDGDGLYEDVNGNGEVNVVDVQAMFANRDDAALTGNPKYFDFSGNAEVNIVDVQALFAELTA